MTFSGSTEELESLIVHLANKYEVGDECIDLEDNPVSDAQYDALYDELKSRKPNSYVFSYISPSDISSDTKKFFHHSSMTSLEKFNGSFLKRKEELHSWLNESRILLKYLDSQGNNNYDDRFTISWKRDGVAIRIYYENGKLIKAGLRPRKGRKAEDVTENVKFISSVPLKLARPLTFSITGELECWNDDFERINKELSSLGKEVRKNPRNHTAGAIRQFKDPSKTKNAKIRFTAYSIEEYEGSDFKTEVERQNFANSLGFNFIEHMKYNFNEILKMEKEYQTLPYGVDGIVISVNNLEDQEQLGRHGDKEDGNPRGKVAWKFADQEKQAIVDHIEWQVGRTGRVIPVVIFESGIELEGTTVKQATGHNVGWLKRMRIGKKTKVNVIKSGKIIPKIINVIENFYSPEIPSSCPSCGYNLIEEEGANDNIDLVCKNNHCSSKRISQFKHFVTSIDMLGIGESQIEKIINHGYLTDIFDFFLLTEEKLKTCGLTERQSILALAAIQMIPNPSAIKDNNDLKRKIYKAKECKKKIPSWKLWASFGISNAGRTTGKLLFEKFDSFNDIMMASKQELEDIDGIGEVSAQNIIDYMSNNYDIINKLLQFIEPQGPVKGSMTGKTFCLSGKIEGGKSKWQKEIESHGGKISSSVGSKIDYLVAGSGSGLKSEKANELNIPILSIEDVKEMIS